MALSTVHTYLNRKAISKLNMKFKNIELYPIFLIQFENNQKTNFYQYLKKTISKLNMRFKKIVRDLSHGPLLLDGLLGAEMMNLLKIRNFLKSSFGVNVKVHISHQKKFCKAMFIHFRFIVSQSL